jgi:hypothetical protein
VPLCESSIGANEKLLAHAVDKALIVRDNDDPALPCVDCIDQRVKTLCGGKQFFKFVIETAAAFSLTNVQMVRDVLFEHR